MAIGLCPECNAGVPFDEIPSINMRAVCPRCRSVLVVIGQTPIKLDWAFVGPLPNPIQENSDNPIGRDGKNGI